MRTGIGRAARRALVGVMVLALAASMTALASAAALPPGGTFTDDDGNVHESNIEALAASGITQGCNPPVNDLFCPAKAVTRAQMATFLTRALSLPPATGSFTDTAGNVHEANIGALAAAGITVGCNPPANDRFCPDQPVTRGQMATFLTRALDLEPIQPPPRGSIPLDGTGNDVLSVGFEPNSYIGVLEIAHTGSSNFIVWLRSMQTSDDLLVNEIGPYTGKVAFQIDPTVDDYLLEIKADGSWSGAITTIDSSNNFDVVPSNHSGSGDDVVLFRITSSAFVEFTATHSGSSNFIIWVYDISSDDRDLVVNEIGVFSGTQLETLSAGRYAVGIAADGAWTLELALS